MVASWKILSNSCWQVSFEEICPYLVDKWKRKITPDMRMAIPGINWEIIVQSTIPGMNFWSCKFQLQVLEKLEPGRKHYFVKQAGMETKSPSIYPKSYQPRSFTLRYVSSLLRCCCVRAWNVHFWNELVKVQHIQKGTNSYPHSSLYKRN